MTAPRQILRGTTHLVTRRTLRRKFLLRPGKVTNHVFAYLLAVAARRTGVKLHAYCVMSNHYHLVVTDPGANLPLFVQYLDSQVGRAINALFGLKQYFWDPNSYGSQPLESCQDIVDKASYVLANPVTAGLVRHARKWPGLWSSPDRIGTKLQVERPTHYFDPDGDMPKAEVLELSVPPGFESAADFRTQLEAGLQAREEQARRDRLGFLGVARVLKQRVLDRPTTPEVRGALRPRVVAAGTALRVELIRRLKAFLEAHRDALLAWRAGRRDVVFPAGTYLMRVAHGAVCGGECAGAG